jgi:phage terminase Nu1 subunit (DNA packaging protein)
MDGLVGGHPWHGRRYFRIAKKEQGSRAAVLPFCPRGAILEIKITRETTVNTQSLSNVIGITTRHINRLDDEGVFVKIDRGKYQLCASVKTYIEKYVRPDENADKKVSFNEEKALLTKAQREKAEIELDELRDSIYRSDYIIPIMQNLLLGVRNRLLAIPQRCAPQVMAASESIDVQEIIRREIYDALSELAEWKPESLSRKRGKQHEIATKD